MHIVVVDDEERLVALICRYLEGLGMTTTACYDGRNGLAAALGSGVDAVILDRMLPGRSGEQVCQSLRSAGSQVPVLMLTARGSVPERVEGLEAGADDYLVKPFALEELHARLRALLRRPPTLVDRYWELGDVSLDRDEHRLQVAGRPVELSRRDYAVLEALVEAFGRVVTRQRLFETVWPEGADLRSNALDVHLARVRKALACSDSVRIKTLRGVGYRLERTAQ